MLRAHILASLLSTAVKLLIFLRAVEEKLNAADVILYNAIYTESVPHLQGKLFTFSYDLQGNHDH